MITTTSPRHLACPSVRAVRIVHEDATELRTLDPRSVYTFGRTDRAEIVLLDPSVSRLHALMWSANGLWHIKDLGSANGTFVYALEDYEVHLRTGAKLPAERLDEDEDRVLRPGEGVLLGTRRVRVEALAEVPSSSSAFTPRPTRGLIDFPTLPPGEGRVVTHSGPSSTTVSDTPARAR